MQNNQLQRAINLTKKNGDRLVVFDKADSEEPFVVMSLDDYEKLVIGHNEVRGLTENELLDKINRDIAIWKSDSVNDDISDQNRDFNSKISDFDTNDGNNDFKDFHECEDEDVDGDDYNEYEDEIEDIYKEDFSSPGLKNMHESLAKKENVAKKRWSIPSNRKNAAEEVVDSNEEERQYLEELPF